MVSTDSAFGMAYVTRDPPPPPVDSESSEELEGLRRQREK